MNTKQKAVDVLAVMDNFIDPVNFPHQPHDLTEARAAVAELIGAAEEKLAALSPDGIGHYRLRDALARCKGE